MPTTSIHKRSIEKWLTIAGIRINGDNPWDIQVHDERFYRRVLNTASLGLGESYAEGWWDCAHLDQFFFRGLRAHLEKYITHDPSFIYAAIRIRISEYMKRWINLQSRRRAYQVGQQHYDLGNDLFVHMLDPRMNYSCGYWKNSTTLAEAQEAKLHLACEKLQLKPGMRVLDIGCGWGGFSKFAAEHYGVSVIGITVAKEQYDHLQKTAGHLPVEVRLQDYRLIHDKFDRICSIGMFEHVGHKNYRAFFKVAHRCLTDDGLMLLHSIGSNTNESCGDPWMEKFIFPNGMLPSITQLGNAIEKLFVMEDWHNFGADYDKTLMAWHKNFNDAWDTTLSTCYDERFRRLWNYYLLSCAGAFRARYTQLWQIVLSKNGVLGGYTSVR